jgi:hypothetical protein
VLLGCIWGLCQSDTLLLLLLLLLISQAMQALDEKHLMAGSVTPLAVKWADPELQIKKRRAVEDSNADNRMVSAVCCCLFSCLFICCTLAGMLTKCRKSVRG